MAETGVTLETTLSLPDADVTKEALDEDAVRLAKLGYKQEYARVFNTWTNFGLTSSMVSVLLGIVPLYTTSLTLGGSVVMVWSWVVIGVMTLFVVTSLAEICAAFPTMGALYFWAHRLGGPEWGPFAAWTAGWCNLLGQIGGVASGGYSGAVVIGEIVTITTGTTLDTPSLFGIFAACLVVAGVVNTLTDTMLTGLCYISVVWHIVGVIVIIALMNCYAPTHQSVGWVLGNFYNGSGGFSNFYAGLAGLLAAATTYTGYDTGAHVAEETSNSHNSSPLGMIGAVANCLILGVILIIGMNFAIQDIDELVDPNNAVGAASTLWVSLMGVPLAVFCNVITFVAVECSNCANMTSCARMTTVQPQADVQSARRSSQSAMSEVLSITGPGVQPLVMTSSQQGEEVGSPKCKDQLINIPPTNCKDPTTPYSLSFLLVMWYHIHWLWLPLLCLGGSLVGIFFIEDQKPYVGSMVLSGVVNFAVIIYFFFVGAFSSRRLLHRIAEDAKEAFAAGPDAGGMLSPDLRVQYVQRELLSVQDLMGPRPTDPLFFLASAITSWKAAKEGYVVTNSVGLILHCNDAALRHFQYAREELLSEDIATLIPAPYNHLHGALMGKYDRSRANQKVMGCARPMPTVKKSGEQCVVELQVEEVSDPNEPTFSVFIGRMTFPEGPALVAELEGQLAQGTPVPAACRALRRKENYLVINTTGVIVFVNEGLSSMLGWREDDLLGKNVSMLMNPNEGKNHDGYLARYVEQLAGAGGAWPPSKRVGHGMDVAVRCEGGGYVRAWLTVEGLHAPSRRPRDCCFVGTLVFMQGTRRTQQRRNTNISDSSSGSATFSSSSSWSPLSGGNHNRTRLSLASALSRTSRSSKDLSPASTNTPNRGPRLPSMARRRCTTMLFDVHGLQHGGDDPLSTEYQNFLNLLITACNKNGMHIHDPVGDRVLVTSNLSASGTSQRSLAGTVIHQVLQAFYAAKSHGLVQVYAAACNTEAHIGPFGKQTILVGEGYDLCVCMLQLAHEARARHGFIDPSLFAELQFTYNCRMVNVVTLHPRHKRSRTLPIYELFSPKDMNEDEWMYQVDGRKREDPLAAWHQCWTYLQKADAPTVPGHAFEADGRPRINEAMECLDRHLDDYDGDPLAVWLLKVLRQADGAATAVEMAGKLRYIAQYALLEHAGVRRTSRGAK